MRSVDNVKSAKVTRRSFLVGLGATGVSAPAAALMPSGPRVFWSGSVLNVAYLGRHWALDGAAFGRDVLFKVVRARQGYLIRIDRASLPGTSVRLRLSCQLVQIGRAWMARLNVPLLGLRAEVPLEDWLGGNPIESRGREVRFAAGNSELRAGAGRRTISSKDGLSLGFRGRVRLAGAVDCDARGVDLGLFSPDRISKRGLTSVSGWGSRFELLEPHLRRRGFGCGAADGMVTVAMGEAARVDGVVSRGTAGPAEAVFLEGPARFEYRTRRGVASAVRFDRAVVAVSKERLGVVGDPGPNQQLVTAVDTIASASGVPGALFQATFNAGQAPAFALPLRIATLQLPVSGAGDMVMGMAGQTMVLAAVPGQRPRFTRAQNREAGQNALTPKTSIIDGFQINMELGFDTPIRVRRLDNLFDLTFHFVSGFTFKRGPDPASTEFRLARTSKATSGKADAGLVIVVFGPQHQNEPLISCIKQPNGTNLPTVTCPLPTNPTTLFARQSRIVFRLDPEEIGSRTKWHDVPLDARTLSDWSRLNMVVDGRAAGSIKDDDWKTQLQVAGIKCEPPDERDLDGILAAIAGQFGPPRAPGGLRADFVTALELADDLVFSPAESAEWETSPLPEPSVDDQAGTYVQDIPLFGMRIGREDDRLPDQRVGRDARLRALWSHRLTPHKMPRPENSADLCKNPPGDRVSPLTADDHWQIIGQTSLYGLPALRRDLPDEEQADPAKPQLGKSARRVPRGGVVRPILNPAKPNDTLPYVMHADRLLAIENGLPPGKPAPPELGIALATAFETGDVTLTPLGATMRLDWRGEPAALKPLSKAPLGFSLERLAYESWLGRDVRVIAVTKGFLLPFGTRASLVKLAERTFVAGPGQKPVAYEVLREFLVVPRLAKRYPAVNQPHAGREFPASTMTVLTSVSPDLVDPRTVEGGALFPADCGRGMVFWPKVPGPGGEPADFDWRCALDDHPTPMITKMMFLDNIAANTPATVEEAVARYNADAEGRNVARLGGARRGYAEREPARARNDPARAAAATANGPDPILDLYADTAFDSDSWVLRAEGRLLAEGEHSYVMDARMNGADQPPFYPRVEKARIAVQSIDRLVGQPQGLVEVKFYEPFVRHGFTNTQEAQNATAEIFLEILKPSIMLNVANARPTVGGITQPHTIAAALSRRIGVVGGAETGPAPAAAEGTRLNFSAAEKGKFDPKQFFKLKLFGVDLTGLVFDDGSLLGAPKLSEVTELGVAPEAFTTLQHAAGVAASSISEDLQPRIAAAIAKLNLPPPVTVRRLYPDLFRAYDQGVATIVDELRLISQAPTATAAIGRVQPLVRSVEPLNREIGRVLRDPVPPEVNELIDHILGGWGPLERTFRELPIVLAARLQLEARARVVQAADALAPVLGVASGESLVALLESQEGRERLGEGLLADVVIEPLSIWLGGAQAFAVETGGLMLLELKAATAVAATRLRRAIDERAAVLTDIAHAAHNILRRDDADALASAIAKAVVNAVLEYPPKGADPAAAVKALKAGLESDLPLKLEAAVRKELVDRRSWIAALDPARTQEIFDAVRLELEAALLTWAIGKVTAELPDLERRVQELVDGKIQTLLPRIAAQFQTFSGGAKSLYATAQIARDGLGLANWCNDQLEGPRAVALLIGNGLLNAQTALQARLASMQAAVARIAALTPPISMPQSVRDSFLRARARLAQHQLDVERIVARLADARADVLAAADTDICIDFAMMAEALGRTLQARADMAQEIIAAAQAVTDLMAVADQPLAVPISEAAASAEAANPFFPELTAALKVLAAEAGALAAGVTAAAAAASATPEWKQVRSAAVRLARDIADSGYRASLNAALQALEASARLVQDELNRVATDPRRLSALATAVALVASSERALASRILQTVAFDNRRQERLLGAARGAVQTLASLIGPSHGDAVSALEKLTGLLQGNDILPLFFTQLQKLKDAVVEARANQVDLQLLMPPGVPIPVPPTPQEIDAAIGRLVGSWSSQPPLIRAAMLLAAAIEEISQGKFGTLVAEALRGLFEQLRQELTDALAELIPTSIATSYDWATNLEKKDGIFAMARHLPAVSGAAEKSDLTIKTEICYDFKTRHRSMKTRGELQKFAVGLPTAEKPDYFRVVFKPVEFVSINGSAPQLKVIPETVTLGSNLKFLKDLQKLLSPSGTGLFAELAPDGITVGFRLATGLQMVGSLQLINLAFEIYTRLSFGNEPTKFGFRFASRERPFLISNPPYGGGGYVVIEAQAGGAKPMDIELSFMFGAVTAIEFGPLTGQGRICAGISYSSAKQVLEGFVEAVGEGNIACFSISIYIRISLTHYPNGEVRGKATYRFRFKIGFASVSYRVDANYKVSGGGSGNASLAPWRPAGTMLAAMAATAGTGNVTPALMLMLTAMFAADGTGNVVHLSKVPKKTSQWNLYLTRLSTDLI
jgi:hypothetical protein